MAYQELNLFPLSTSQSILADWCPLPANKHTESRPCHCSNSRVHVLSCGHTIALTGDAETCAGNCAGMEHALYISDGKEQEKKEQLADRESSQNPTFTSTDLCEVTESRKSLKDMYQSSLAAAKHYADTYLDDDGRGAMMSANEFMQVFHQMLLVKQRPRFDLISGDFACAKCGTHGPRKTLPAYIHRPMGIVIVVQKAQDAAIVQDLESGGMPVGLEEEVDRRCGRRCIWNNRGRGREYGSGRASSDGRNRGSNRGRGHRSLGRGIRHGRINRQRMEEKSRVLTRLANENLLEELSSMGL